MKSHAWGGFWLDVVGAGVIGMAIAWLGWMVYCGSANEYGLFDVASQRTALGGFVAGAGGGLCYWMFTGRLRRL